MISIIVPVYNSAQYIGDCVASVLAQTYEHFELLLVDDGSQDNSAALCEAFCRGDLRVHLLCQEHRGVSAARNAGMRKAEGKYLFFLDSDDVIHPQLLETLYRQQESMRSAMATVGCCCVGEEPSHKPGNWEMSDVGEEDCCYLNNEQAIKRLISGNQEAMLYIIGGKMIRCEALKDICFDEGLLCGEDTLFIYRLLAFGGTDVSVLRRNWYGYRRNENGAVKRHSVTGCENIYRVQKYMQSQEINSGRMSNAIHVGMWMEDTMIQWYIEGRELQDVEWMKYIKKLALTEKKKTVLRKEDWLRRIRFFLVFHCYPLYWMARCCREVLVSPGKISG